MKKALSIAMISLSTLCIACYKTSTNRENPVVIITPTPQQFDSPQKVALSLFEAARYTSWNRLPGLCMPDGTSDKSAQELCDVGKTADDKRTAFREDFMQGGIDGTSEIGTDTAKIKIMYSKKLSRSALLTLKKVEGRWYIVSFDPK